MNLAVELYHSINLHSSRTAIVQRGLRWTYAQLGEHATTIAERLFDAGITPGDRVILWMENCAEYVASYLGILKAGGVVVALHPQLLSKEVEDRLSMSKPKE
jgi:acyl-CoA synthetase (AMP-forming)/AMP-acid ligase II